MFRRLRKGEPGILDEYLDSSLYQGIHPSIHSSIHSSGDRIPKSFTQESFKYQVKGLKRKEKTLPSPPGRYWLKKNIDRPPLRRRDRVKKEMKNKSLTSPPQEELGLKRKVKEVRIFDHPSFSRPYTVLYFT